MKTLTRQNPGQHFVAQELIKIIINHVAELRFVKIDPTELPQAVMQTLAKDYEGASVKEAYVKETEETTLYKIIIVTQDGQEAETLLNEKGEIVKE